MNLKIIITSTFIFLNYYLFSQSNKDTIYFNNATSFYEMKKYDKALFAIDSALIINPEEPLYYDYKSDILKGLKDYKYAGEILDFAKEKFPNDPYTHYKKGEYLAFIGELELAQKEYELAYEVAQSDSIKQEMKLYQASIKSLQGKYDEAKIDLTELLQVDSNNLLVIMELGNIEDELANPKKAEQYYRKTIEIDSSFIPAYMNIGYLLQNEKRYLESFKYYEKALELDNSIEFLYYSNQSINLVYLNKAAQALEYVEKSINMNPFNSYAFRNKANILIELERFEEACNSLEQALNLGFTKNYGDEVLNLKINYCRR